MADMDDKKHGGKWDAAKQEHGGKHAKAIQALQDTMARGTTPEQRTQLFLAQSAANLAQMIADGASLDDFALALQHILDNAAVIKDAIATGF